MTHTAKAVRVLVVQLSAGRLLKELAAVGIVKRRHDN